MIRTSLRAAVLATAALLFAAIPAHAAKVVVKDPTGDVYTTTMEIQTFTPIGTRLNADVKRTVITHDRKAVTVKASYTDLAKNSDVISLGTFVRTNAGLKRDLTFVALPGKRKGLVTLSRHNSIKEVACKGLSHRIDYSGNTIRITVPRICIGNPRWVQFQIGAGASDVEFSKIDIDDAQRPDVTSANTWGKKVKVG